jgi:hypothetical protein
MTDPVLVTGITGTTVVALLNSEVGKKVSLPLAEQFGLILGDFGECLRANMARILEKWTPLRDGRPLSKEEMLKALPLLLLGSSQGDSELHQLWAALLENTVGGVPGVLPSFGQTLSQLTPGEARFLNRLFAFVTQPRNELSEHAPGRRPLDFVTLAGVFDPSINTGINPAEREFFKDKMTKEQLDNYDRLTEAELIIEDLERLKILTREQVVDQGQFWRQDFFTAPLTQSDTVLRVQYSLTQYGISFIRAVTPKDVSSVKGPIVPSNP